MSAPAPGRARFLPWILAGVLSLETVAGLTSRPSTAELATRARTGEVRDRASALYRLSTRGDGSGATAEILGAAPGDDPRLTVLVERVLDRAQFARSRWQAVVRSEPDPATARYLQLMLNTDRTLAEYRELLGAEHEPASRAPEPDSP